ncbi:hypothetical protein [Haliangium sp.]|uniref:hypothetical protein n=1 Tax=Haliangium sp. TaxID=2663208 RepID=UPI003D0EE77B
MNTKSPLRCTRTALARGQAALLAFVFVAAQLGGFVHEVFEQHTRCAEHGEVVHVDTLARAAAQGAPLVADGGGDCDALRDDSSAAGNDGHEHCYLSMSTRERLAPAVPVHSVGLVATPERVHAASPPAAPAERERYTIAPKTSPPQA